jgi:predicted nucleic acid-binding protein
MLYLDASALAKRYFNEEGSDLVAARFESGERIFTSLLSFAEIHSAIARKFRDKELETREFARLRDTFQNDWLFSLSSLDLDLNALTALPRLLETYSLKAGDAIHLSTAVWLKDSLRLGAWSGEPGQTVEFGVADNRLAKVAQECGFHVFNPEDGD